MDVNAGLAYQHIGLQGNYRNTEDQQDFRQAGIISEANFHITTPYIGISPFVFFNINIKGISTGLGTKIMIGKPGYTKRELSTIAGN